MSVAKRPNGSWLARYRPYPKAPEITKSFPRKRDGEEWVIEQLASIAQGTYLDPRGEKMLLREYVQVWETAQGGRDNTKVNTRTSVHVHILPTLGEQPLASFRRTDIQKFVKALPLAASSVRMVYERLANIFQSAVLDRLIPASPCINIRLPELEDNQIVLPTFDEVVILRDAMPPLYQALVIFLALSGLRIGEALGLRISDVDFLRRSVRVERQRLQRSNELGPTKTRSSVRTVPLSQFAVDVLAAHLAEFRSSEEWLFTPTGYRKHPYLTYAAWSRVWRKAREGAGLLHLGTHELRHFYASALISGGCSVKQVQEALGHRTAMETLKTYTHLWPGDEDTTRDVIDSQLGFLRTGCGLEPAGITVVAGQKG